MKLFKKIIILAISFGLGYLTCNNNWFEIIKDINIIEIIKNLFS